jgi:hypothetical protein
MGDGAGTSRFGLKALRGKRPREVETLQFGAAEIRHYHRFEFVLDASATMSMPRPRPSVTTDVMIVREVSTLEMLEMKGRSILILSKRKLQR